MSPLSNNPQEWLEQAENDLEAAEAILRIGYNYYAVFLCHLSVEKALKGLYFKKLGLTPPKIHNLAFFIDKIALPIPEQIEKHLLTINEAHLATRYPEEYKTLQRQYPTERVREIIALNKETIQWIKTKF
jgi:HEPN domain-containing protein